MVSYLGHTSDHVLNVGANSSHTSDVLALSVVNLNTNLIISNLYSPKVITKYINVISYLFCIYMFILTFSMSKAKCLKSLERTPLGPLMTTARFLTSPVTIRMLLIGLDYNMSLAM